MQNFCALKLTSYCIFQEEIFEFKLFALKFSRMELHRALKAPSELLIINFYVAKISRMGERHENLPLKLSCYDIAKD